VELERQGSLLFPVERGGNSFLSSSATRDNDK
jgi:hypothetical protein